MMLAISPEYGLKADAVRLIEAARKNNNIRVVTNLNLSAYKEQELEECGAPIALYGDNAFCEFLAQELRCNLWSNSLDWITKIPKQFLKRQIIYMTLGEAIKKERAEHSILDKTILEPADNERTFVKGIYQESFPNVPLHTPILIHPIIHWEVKYRFVIINNEIATFSCYRMADVRDTPTLHTTKFVGRGITADEFVSNLLKDVNTAPSCIIDVGYSRELGWSVCGSYPMWSSELYGCNPEIFLQGLFAACQVMTN